MNKTPRIICADHEAIDPESMAMLQAFYSRSHKSIKERFDQFDQEQAESIKAALSRYYVGYGHASIGDCSSVTIFIEDVSLLAAKAIQDYLLYNGQESSTRYIPFHEGKLSPDVLISKTPGLVQELQDIFNDLVLINGTLTDVLFTDIKAQNPEFDDAAIKARAFDVARGVLPNGVATQLSWTTSFRKFYEHTKNLLSNPFKEVRELALMINAQLHEKYPSAIPLIKNPDEIEVDESLWFLPEANKFDGRLSLNGQLSTSPSEDFSKMLLGCKERMPDGTVNQVMSLAGTVSLQSNIDFGSYRDLQRHRSACIRSSMPSGVGNGFNAFYLDEIGRYPEIAERILDVSERIESLKSICPKPDLAYVTPLMATVNIALELSIPSLVYVLELRSKPSVHPSLRDLISRVFKAISNCDKDTLMYEIIKKLDINLDETPDGVWSERGKQTITENGRPIQ